MVNEARSEPAPGSLNSWHQISSPASSGPGSGPSGPACRQKGWGRPSRSRWCWSAGAPRPDAAPRPRSAGGWGRRRGPTAPASGVPPGRLRPGGGPRRRVVLKPRRRRSAGVVVRRQCEVHVGQRRLTRSRWPPPTGARRLPAGTPTDLCAGGTQGFRVDAGQDEERTVSTWNYGDVWEAVADALPDAPALTHGSGTRQLGRAGPAGRRRGPRLLGAGVVPRTRWPSTSTTAPSTSRSPSPASRSAWSPSTPTTGTPTTSWSTCGRTPTRWRWYSTAPSWTASRGSGTGCSGCRPGCGSTTARPRARLGRALRGGRPPGRAPAGPERVGAPWGRSRTTSTCCTPGGPPGCPRVSCGARTISSPGSTAPGFRRYPEDGGRRRCAAPSSKSGPGMTLLPACPLMHGTGGFTSSSA